MKKQIKKIVATTLSLVLVASIVPLDFNVANGADYLVRDPFYNYSSGYNYYESEHFQFIWGNSGDSTKVTVEFLEGNAKNLEDCWDVYMKDLAMAPPSESVNLSLRDGNEYKTNIYISGTGLSGMQDDWAYMSYDSGGFAYMFCCVDSMQYTPPSWVLPHEFGHVVTAHQLGWNSNKYSYAWWEAMGNWFREQYLYSDYSNDTSGYGTDFFETYLKNSSLTFPCGRDYYAAWPFLQYLTENPDGLSGYGSDFVKTMLQNGNVDEYPFEMIERLAPADLKDTLGHYAKRMATLDLESQDSYQARLNDLLNQGSWNWQQIYTMLEPVAGQENTYQVPTERAPQHAGLNIIPLTVTGNTIEIKLNGLIDVQGADWRACIVQELNDGSTIYSDLFSDGETSTMSVNANVKNAYLTVIATPDEGTYLKVGLPYGPDSEFAENKCAFTDKQQYPYSAKITGAEITKRTVNSFGEGSNHSNGGGFVASTAKVDASVYVGPNAKVLGNAIVSGNARIEDYAVVQDRATVSDNAVISGYAIIAENAKISGNARVDDYGLVMQNAQISGNAKVIESALIYGTFTMTDNAIAKGMAFCMANGSISGQGVVDGDYYDDGGKTVTKGTAYGWVSAQSYVDSLGYTDKLITAYDFNENSSLSFDDRYTSTYGVSVGSPLWESSRTSANGVVTFDGKQQYAQLDRSLLYTSDIEIQLAVLPRGGNSEQSILHLGNDTSYIKLLASNGEGVPEVVFKNGNTVEKLTSKSLLQLGSWSTIRVILDGDNAKLIINNETVASGTVTINPSDIANSISLTDKTAGYVLSADNNGDNNFNGSVDFLRVFTGETQAPTETYSGSEEVISTEKTLVGDVNFDNRIDSFDIMVLKKALQASGLMLSSKHIAAYDINGDGFVTTADLVILQSYILNITTEFPAGTYAEYYI